jgi:hypothetical protein
LNRGARLVGIGIALGQSGGGPGGARRESAAVRTGTIRVRIPTGPAPMGNRPRRLRRHRAAVARWAEAVHPPRRHPHPRPHPDRPGAERQPATAPATAPRRRRFRRPSPKPTPSTRTGGIRVRVPTGPAPMGNWLGNGTALPVAPKPPTLEQQQRGRSAA